VDPEMAKGLRLAYTQPGPLVGAHHCGAAPAKLGLAALLWPSRGSPLPNPIILASRMALSQKENATPQKRKKKGKNGKIKAKKIKGKEGEK